MRTHFVAKAGWLKIRLDFRVQNHVMVQSVLWTFHTLNQLNRGSLGRTAALMLWYRRRWQVTAFLTLFFLQIKPANNGAPLGARQAHRQQLMSAAAESETLYDSTILLFNIDATLWTNRYLLLQWTKTINSGNQGEKTKLSFEKGIYMLGGTTDEGTNVKVGFRRPWRGKRCSSKEVDETKRTNMGATELRSPRPRETDPCGVGSWSRSYSHLLPLSPSYKGLQEKVFGSPDSVLLYVKPEWAALIRAKRFISVWTVQILARLFLISAQNAVEDYYCPVKPQTPELMSQIAGANAD